MADNPPSAAFVATLGRQVVGIFVADRGACTGEDVSRIRSDFNVEEFVSFDRHRPRNQAVLVALAINPIFAGQCRFAFKEVRQGGNDHPHQGSGFFEEREELNMRIHTYHAS